MQGEVIPLRIMEPDGSVRLQESIASTWDDVGNKVAEGVIQEKDRARCVHDMLIAQINAERNRQLLLKEQRDQEFFLKNGPALWFHQMMQLEAPNAHQR